MKSIFSELPNNLIIKIIQIDNYRKKYDKVVEQINMVTTYDMFCPSISKAKRPRIYKWIEEEERWTCRNSNKYRSLEGLDEQGLWEKYGRE